MTEWFREFFDRDYTRFLRLQKDDEETRAEVDFVASALKLRPGARVLDVGCGFGRHAGELARRGFLVVGLDYSRSMVEMGRRIFPSVEFVRADMRTLDRPGEFDAVINMFNSFGYFTCAENRDVLRRMARALRPGGRLLIDHRDRKFVEDHVVPTRWADLHGIFVMERCVFDRPTGRVNSTWLIARASRLRLSRRMLRLYTYYEHEWRQMLAGAGLRLERAFSDLSGTPHLPGAHPRLILIAAAADPKRS